MNKFCLLLSFVAESLCCVWTKVCEIFISVTGESDFFNSFNEKDRVAIKDLIYEMRRNKITKTEFTDSKGITYIVET